MRVLYVAPRYHTNQVPIMRGWLKNGHQVLFISQVVSEGEDHRDLEPVRLGYSELFNFFFSIRNRLRHCEDPDEKFWISSKKGFPPYHRLKKLIKDFKPDVAILRERSLYNIVVYRLCKRWNIPCILYNQSPVWEKKRESNPWLRRLVRKLSPQYRMTVTEGVPGPDMVRDPHTYWVSFVMEPHVPKEPKVYCKDGVVHFLCVARFVEWKNHMLLLSVYKNLFEKYPVHLTIVGEAVSDIQKAFYAKVVKYIQDNHMENAVTLIRNANRDQVFEQYEKADVFLLPSKEPISVSQLEAMSFSLPVICSDLPGKATYVKNNLNGYLVEVNNADDLQDKMEKMIQNKDRMQEMGRKSLELVMANSSFQNYYDHILQIMKDMREKKTSF